MKGGQLFNPKKGQSVVFQDTERIVIPKFFHPAAVNHLPLNRNFQEYVEVIKRMYSINYQAVTALNKVREITNKKYLNNSVNLSLEEFEEECKKAGKGIDQITIFTGTNDDHVRTSIECIVGYRLLVGYVDHLSINHSNYSAEQFIIFLQKNEDLIVTELQQLILRYTSYIINNNLIDRESINQIGAWDCLNNLISNNKDALVEQQWIYNKIDANFLDYMELQEIKTGIFLPQPNNKEIIVNTIDHRTVKKVEPLDTNISPEGKVTHEEFMQKITEHALKFIIDK